MRRKFLPLSASNCLRRRHSTMASHCIQHFPITNLSPWLLALVLTMTWLFTLTESAAPIQLRGEVGGKVTISCPIDKQRTLIFLYFQKGQSFVNGYHRTKNISQPPWENTRVDHDKTTIHMYNLSVSHSGDYQCHIRYDNDNDVAGTAIHLTVTAAYSTPALTVHHTDEKSPSSFQVTCTSHGGYPGSEVKWNVSGSQMWKVVNSSEMTDPDTMLVNSSSTAFFNCSNGGVTTLSCSVGGLTSKTIPVCDRGKPTDPDNSSPYVYIAAICLVVVIIMVSLLLWWKRKKGQRGGATVAVSQVNGCEERVTMLDVVTEGQDAS